MLREDRPFTAFEANGKLYQFCRLPFGVTNGVSFFQRTIDSVIESYNLKGCLAYLDNITIFGKNQIEHDINLNAFFDVAKKLNLTFNQQKSIISVKEIKMLGYLVSKGSIRPDPERFKPLMDLPLPQTKRELKRIVGMFWRIELGSFSYDIVYKRGQQNVAPDAFSRVCASLSSSADLDGIHKKLGHPGVSRLIHFIRMKNLPFSVEDVKRVCSQCRTCAEIKPQFYKPDSTPLIKATRPWERISIDFKGPISSKCCNPFLLVVIDEFSRFPFAFPCKNVSSQSVISCLTTLFSIFGLPGYVHSDRGAAFMSRDLKSFLHSRGVATSRTTPYHPTGNAQCERYNQTIWKTVQLFLRNNRLPEEQWEMVLTDALHSVRSLLCTATNATPHEQFLSFPRKSMLGKSLPSWLTSPGTVLLRRFVRQRKSDPLCDEVELVEANPSFAHVRYPDGRETTVALKDLAPCPTVTESSPDDEQYNQESTVSVDTLIPSPSPPQPVVFNPSTTSPPSTPGPSTPPASPTIPPAGDKTSTTPPLRRSTRQRRPPDRYGEGVPH